MRGPIPAPSSSRRSRTRPRASPSSPSPPRSPSAASASARAASTAPAFAATSADSRAGTESATMPAPAWTMRRPVDEHHAPDGDRRPRRRRVRSTRRRRRTAPRRSCSTSAIACIARTFGAPDSVPAGNVARTASNASRSGRRRPSHLGHDVHHMRIALDAVEQRRMDAAGLGDAADVVAGQVDEHRVLRQLLLVGQQVAPPAPASRTGSSDRGRVPAIGRVRRPRRRGPGPAAPETRPASSVPGPRSMREQVRATG